VAAIDPELFRRTLDEEVRAAWHTLREANSGSHFYAFGVYTTDLVEHLGVCAATEEGLARVGGMRWSLCDSPLHPVGGVPLTRSAALRDAGPDPYADSAESRDAIALVYRAIVEVLRAVDDELGSREERERMVVSIWKGDQPNDERVAWARALNPASVAARFAEELAHPSGDAGRIG
jgi:hypothetical protein